MVGSNARVIGPDGSDSGELWNHDLSSDTIITAPRFLRRLVLGDPPFCLSGVVFRTDLARRLGGFDTRFSQTLDWHLWMKLSLHADVAYLVQPLVAYRRHPETATARRRPFDNILQVYLAKMDILKRHRAGIPGAGILEDQFRTHFAKGLLASSIRAWRGGDRRLAGALLDLCCRAAPDPTFLAKGPVLGLLQWFFRKRVYPSRLLDGHSGRFSISLK
jgi:hypothetical protein